MTAANKLCLQILVKSTICCFGQASAMVSAISHRTLVCMEYTIQASAVGRKLRTPKSCLMQVTVSSV